MKTKIIFKSMPNTIHYTLVFELIGRYIIAWGISILGVRIIELSLNFSAFTRISEYHYVLFSVFVEDTFFFIKSIPFIAILVFSILYISGKKVKIICLLIFVCFFSLLSILSLYFVATSVLLGSDAFAYSWKDLQQTIGTTHISETTTIGMIGNIIVLFLILKLHNLLKIEMKWVLRLVIFCTFFSFIESEPNNTIQNEYAQNLCRNKGIYFFSSLYESIWGGTTNDSDLLQTSEKYNFSYFPKNTYPFYHIDKSSDVLGTRMRKIQSRPNIIFIVVEGLGRAFSGEMAYLGSFTPFLDSLAKKSLYWNNFLSAGGRTFAVLPSLLGSLPFGKTGFSDLEPMPKHFSIMSILQKQGYVTSYFHGGNSNFDNTRAFLKQNGVEHIIDELNFGNCYIKMPTNNGFTWGYDDCALFQRYFQEPSSTNPRLDILQTLSSHSPFILKDQEKYRLIFQNHLKKLRLDAAQKIFIDKYGQILATILFADDAIKFFMHEFSKRPDFKNTIFIITGDHRLPEIPLATKLDRYHVPLIIYSPMLIKNGNFQAISTHFDVAPTIMAYLASNYQIHRPKYTHWIGDGIDTSAHFRNIHSYPLMMTKLQLVDYISGSYWLNEHDVYKINAQMDLEKINDNITLNRLEKEMTLFRFCNQKMRKTGQLIP